MKTIHRFLFIAILLSFFAKSAFAQMMIKRTGNPDEIHVLNELGVILIMENNTIKVDLLPPEDKRGEAWKDVDLQKGDLIMMMNTKRVKSIKELREMYDKLAPSEIVKLGIKRGEEMFISSYPKMAMTTMPGGRRLVINTQEGGPDSEPIDGKMITQTFTFDSDGAEIMPLLGTGFLLKEADHKISIMEIIHPSEIQKQGDYKAGDVLTKFNGEKIESLKKLTDTYDQMKTGDAVELEISRDGKTIVNKFEKPAAEGQMIIKKE